MFTKRYDVKILAIPAQSSLQEPLDCFFLLFAPPGSGSASSIPIRIQYTSNNADPCRPGAEIPVLD